MDKILETYSFKELELFLWREDDNSCRKLLKSVLETFIEYEKLFEKGE
jgi:hypothetical protein